MNALFAKNAHDLRDSFALAKVGTPNFRELYRDHPLRRLELFLILVILPGFVAFHFVHVTQFPMLYHQMDLPVLSQRSQQPVELLDLLQGQLFQIERLD